MIGVVIQMVAQFIAWFILRASIGLIAPTASNAETMVAAALVVIAIEQLASWRPKS